MKNLRDIKRDMWNKNPHCQNCGIETRFNKENLYPIPDDIVTIQHTEDKLSPLRHKTKLLLFCRKCNDEDNRKRQKSYPKQYVSCNGFLAQYLNEIRRYNLFFKGKHIGFFDTQTLFLNHCDLDLDFIKRCSIELQKIK